jgi:outer membrane protein OmpA-like peptidoglycan-associated protein
MNQPSYGKGLWRYAMMSCLAVTFTALSNTPPNTRPVGSEIEAPSSAALYFAQTTVRIKVTDHGTVVTMSDVLFSTASSELSAAAMRGLDDLADVLTLHTESMVLLEGHTDSIGSDEQNFRLSRARAAAVKAYLVERGIDPARLQTNGVGESDPVISNASTMGRRENRNVAVIISNEQVKRR